MARQIPVLCLVACEPSASSGFWRVFGRPKFHPQAGHVERGGSHENGQIGVDQADSSLRPALARTPAASTSATSPSPQTVAGPGPRNGRSEGRKHMMTLNNWEHLGRSLFLGEPEMTAFVVVFTCPQDPEIKGDHLLGPRKMVTNQGNQRSHL